MFDNNIKTETIPERVYELLKLISVKDISEEEAKNKFLPCELNNGKNGAYYSAVKNVCLDELKLIQSEDNKLSYIGDVKIIKNLDTFRTFCNSVVYSNKESYFFKILSCCLESNDEWLKYKTLTDPNIIRDIMDKTNIQSFDSKMILGIRFWLSFLGFGFIQEKNYIYFLPNMYVALKDFCVNSNLEVNIEYTVNEFVKEIYDNASVALTKTLSTHQFNLAMSNALRQMHDSKEIVLHRNLDSEQVWKLFPDKAHEFNEEITHITFKGVKRR